ncbi:MAG: hypothetical protein IKU31_07445 [Oscillospiraceae bacterium]|nr:hypothetical protein [Oscillospiraceae bacterium]
MDGIFRRKKWNRFLNWLGLVSGIGLMGLFAFLMVADPPEHWDDALAAGFFVVFGLVVSVFCIIGLRNGPKIFLHVEEDRILGWTPMGGVLNCAMGDVKAVAWGGGGLNVTLKNGRRYNYTDLRNDDDIGKFIHQRTFVPESVSMDRETLATAILKQKRRCKGRVRGILVSLLFVFLPILLAAFLTDGKELHDFAAADWKIFLILMALGLLAFLAFFLFLKSWVKASAEYERLLSAIPEE